MAENSVKIKIDGDDSGFQSTLSGVGEKAKAGLADIKAGFDMASQAAQKLADASVKVYAGFDDAMRQVQATMNASAQHRVFQSQLLPVWGTTCPSDKKSKKNLISIVAPCAGSDEIAQTYQTVIGAISIHAPRAGSDTGQNAHQMGFIISILAPHAGSDGTLPSHIAKGNYFNPRSPCGERRFRRSYRAN